MPLLSNSLAVFLRVAVVLVAGRARALAPSVALIIAVGLGSVPLRTVANYGAIVIDAGGSAGNLGVAILRLARGTRPGTLSVGGVTRTALAIRCVLTWNPL